MMKTKICNNCCNEFALKKGSRPNAKFCSQYCMGISRKIIDPNHLVTIYNMKVVKFEKCWDWNGNKDTDGYGVLYFNKKMLKAHRASWLIHKGEIPLNMFICHKCDNPICTNPEHLFIGTPKDNVLDMFKKGRHPISKGQDASGAKLNDVQVIQIKKLLETNKSITQIAKMFDVHIVTIHDIKYKKTWGHLNG